MGALWPGRKVGKARVRTWPGRPSPGLLGKAGLGDRQSRALSVLKSLRSMVSQNDDQTRPGLAGHIRGDDPIELTDNIFVKFSNPTEGGQGGKRTLLTTKTRKWSDTGPRVCFEDQVGG